MKQKTLAMAVDQDAGFETCRKATRRDVFLATLNQTGPWQVLCEAIVPHCPRAGPGRPPVGLACVLRMYCVQHGHKLADQACQQALLDSVARRRFVGFDLGRERVPGASRC
jgi:IS5 family transposase